jgi:hypothetical protein
MENVPFCREKIHIHPVDRGGTEDAVGCGSRLARALLSQLTHPGAGDAAALASNSSLP